MLLCAGEVSGVREALARRIAGEIVLSRNPGATMRKWREIFGVSQTRLSKEMGLSPSVLSDYETLVGVAAETGYVTNDEIETLSEWRKDPGNWKKD